jgi:Ca2+-binding EF-hand superfamily protein
MEEEEPTGYVTFAKFEKVALRILQDSTIVRDEEEKIYRAFKCLDSDNKGFLRPDEFKEFLMQNGEKLTQEEMDEMLTSCVDPQENKIYYEDYIKILAK